MKMDHKESFGDFGEQFIKDKEIDGYFGNLELIKDIVYPFDLNEMIIRLLLKLSGQWKNFKKSCQFYPKNIWD